MKTKKKQEPKPRVTEHPELRWWWHAITVKAHNAGARRKR